MHTGKIKFAREICGVLAGIYTALGDRDRAFSLPEIALAKRDAALLALHQHPEFDPIRSDPRFLDLLRRTGLRQ